MPLSHADRTDSVQTQLRLLQTAHANGEASTGDTTMSTPATSRNSACATGPSAATLKS